MPTASLDLGSRVAIVSDGTPTQANVLVYSFDLPPRFPTFPLLAPGAR